MVNCDEFEKIKTISFEKKESEFAKLTSPTSFLIFDDDRTI